MKMNVKGIVSIIADALFTDNGRYHIVEVDHEQKMSANCIKMQKYRKLMECNVFEKTPKFIWYTTTEYRRKQIQKLCEGLIVTYLRLLISIKNREMVHMATETMSIKDFMDGNYGAKKNWSLFKKKVKIRTRGI